jgi:hypothetical protein
MLDAIDSRADAYSQFFTTGSVQAGMVAVRFIQAFVVLGLVGGDQNTHYRTQERSLQFSLLTFPF